MMLVVAPRRATPAARIRCRAARVRARGPRPRPTFGCADTDLRAAARAEGLRVFPGWTARHPRPPRLSRSCSRC